MAKNKGVSFILAVTFSKKYQRKQTFLSYGLPNGYPLAELERGVTGMGHVQRYTYRVLQTIQMKLMLSYVWPELAILGSTKTAQIFKYEI